MILRFLKVFFAVVVLTASSASAQIISDANYEKWNAVAVRAETVLSDDRASDAAYEELRSQIVTWRETFLDGQSENDLRLGTLQAQLAALPAKPEEGLDPVADRRQELNDQIAALNAPIIRAQEAYNRADGIIREIDKRLLDRRTSTILALGPTPFAPTAWLDATETLIKAVNTLSGEVITTLGRSSTQSELKNRLPSFALALIVFMALFSWAPRMARRVSQSISAYSASQTLNGFVVDAVVLVLRIVAVQLLLNAIIALPIFGLRGRLVLSNVPDWATLLLVAGFLTNRLFTGIGAVFNFDNASAIARYFKFGALILVLSYIAELLIQLQSGSDAVRSVVSFVSVTVAAVALWRFLALLKVNMTPNEGETYNLSGLIAKLVYRFCLIIAFAAPVLAAIGFVNGAMALIFPAYLSIALIGAILILQTVTSVVLSAFMHRNADEGDGLLSILMAFIIVLGALPVFALIWGASVSNLTEIWTKFQDGIAFGGTKISPLDFLKFVVIFTVGYSLTRLIQSALRGTVLPKTKLDTGAQNAIVSGLGYVGIFLAAMAAISSTGLDLSSLAIVAGALSVGIGFGLQNIVSNFVSGIILLIERPVSEGDWIEVGGQMGYVRDISVRSTRIETFDRADVIIPNADLVSGVVTNWTRGNKVGRLTVPVGVAYGTDTRRVENILLEIARDQPLALLDPPPSVVFQGFGADSLNFEVRLILRDINFMNVVKTEVNHQIAERFFAEGIEIPFAQRDIYIKNLADLTKGTT